MTAVNVRSAWATDQVPGQPEYTVRFCLKKYHNNTTERSKKKAGVKVGQRDKEKERSWKGEQEKTGEERRERKGE